MEQQLPFILAITGASGSIYGLRLLQYLVEIKQPVELLVSRGARQVMQEEMGLSFGEDLRAELLAHLGLPGNADVSFHRLDNYGATVASGSYRTRGMAIFPCSLGTLGAVSSGLTESLIYRAAAVCLKERRPLLLLLREMPFGQIQLKQMLTLSEAGAIVAAAAPGFYHKPQTVGDMVDFVVGRSLDQLGFDNNLFKRWKEKTPLLSLPNK
ncbi:MAG: UbiX family flavin prenyltransferase [Candidatus Obscuribacterales bacterium]|nr:UbiX family flavin prenyltransferase [Candidatus Obscuribacterales bacterium]